MKRMLSIALCLVAANSISGAVIGHNGKYFTVTESDRSYRVGRESLDGTLKNINHTNLARFLEKGRIEAKKYKDGSSYYLRGHVNGLGGGPITGWIAYWGTKALCYGTGVAAAGTAVVATGGVAGAVTSIGVGLATGGVSTGTTVVALGIAGAGSGAVAESVAITSSAIAAFGGVAGTIAAIESAATSVGLAALACPFLP